MSEKKYNGFYRGIVIQNNDPSRAGRVKIFVPSIMPHAIEKNRLEYSKEKIEVDYKTLFSDGEDAFKDKKALKFLKNNLPWAAQLSPLVGSGSSANFLQKDEDVTTADGIVADQETPRGNFPNKDKMPGHQLQLPPYFYNACHDGSDINQEDMNTGRTDLDNDKLQPDLSSNQAKGMFSIPSVNSHVWLFFENGDFDKPVYFGYDHRDLNWRELYEGSIKGHRGDNYPSEYENSQEPEDEELIIRNKVQFNTKAGKLVFDETDYMQRIQLSYRTGSNFEFDTTGHKLFVQGKSTEAVNGDKFQTVNGELTTCVNYDANHTYKKDITLLVGSRNAALYREAYKVFKKRSVNALDNFWKGRTAGPIDRPDVESAGPVPANYVRGLHEPLEPSVKDLDNLNLYYDTNRKCYSHLPGSPSYIPADLEAQGTQIQLPTPETTNTFTNLHDAIYNRSIDQPTFANKTYEKDRKVLPGDYSDGSFRVGRDDPRVDFRDTTELDLKSNNVYKNRLWFPSHVPGILIGEPDRFRDSNQLAKWDQRTDQNKSPSTAGGSYEQNLEWESVRGELNDLNAELDAILARDAHGGNLATTVTRNALINIGVITNDLPALRVDSRGGLIFAGVRTTDTGSDNVYKSVPIYEETNNEGQFPVGNATLNVGNGFNIKAGSGGINFSTTGVSENTALAHIIKGTHSIELATGGNLRLRAEKAISITADIISIRHSSDGQVGIGGSLGIENNVTVGGSAIINGELYLHHITAPAEIQVTESILNLQARSKKDEQIAYIPEGMVIAKLSQTDCETIYNIGKGDSTGSVSVRAWAEESDAAELGTPPEYQYNSELDDFILEPGTGYKDVTDDNRYGDRAEPELLNGNGQPDGVNIFSNNQWTGSGGKSTNSPALKGTDRLTSIEVEGHGHQFKNLPLSLRSFNDDVCTEAAEVEQYPDIKSLRKGQVHGKKIVKKYGESKRHDAIMNHLEDAREYKEDNLEDIKKGQLLGKKAPSTLDDVAQNFES